MHGKTGVDFATLFRFRYAERSLGVYCGRPRGRLRHQGRSHCAELSIGVGLRGVLRVAYELQRAFEVVVLRKPADQSA